MFRLVTVLPAIANRVRPTSLPLLCRPFGHRRTQVENASLWKELEETPVAESYKKKEFDRRREAIEDDESDDEDMEVIEWTENTRPEDIMDGKDLEAYYTTARNYMHKDTSSSEEEQTKHLQELSKLLKINISDVPGYKTFFQDKNSFDSGIPSNLQIMYDYIDTLIDSHPELLRDFDAWSKRLDIIAQKNIKSMSEVEFRKLAACPSSILSVVDAEHKPLFHLQKSDFIKIDSPSHASSPLSSPPDPKVGARNVPPPKKSSNAEPAEPAEPAAPIQMTHVQKRMAEVFGIMFDSMWKSNAPVSISYVSNGTKLHDIFLYLKFADGLDAKAKQEICKQLESKKHLFVDMLKITLHIPETPNLVIRYTK